MWATIRHSFAFSASNGARFRAGAYVEPVGRQVDEAGRRFGLGGAVEIHDGALATVLDHDHRARRRRALDHLDGPGVHPGSLEVSQQAPASGIAPHRRHQCHGMAGQGQRHRRVGAAAANARAAIPPLEVAAGTQGLVQAHDGVLANRSDDGDAGHGHSPS